LLPYEGFDLAHGSPFDYLSSMGDIAAISDRIARALTFFGHTHRQGGLQIRPNGKITILDVDRVLPLALRSKYLVNSGSVVRGGLCDGRADSRAEAADSILFRKL
jgi:hypothetical protein